MKKLAQKLLLAICIVLLAAQPTSAQLWELDYNENDINHYRDKPLNYCGSTDVTSLLNKQPNLDDQWVPLITNEAKKAGADPLAMASLLFWEHRGFPAYGEGEQPGESDAVGRGPWQITIGTWPSSAGDYIQGVYDPVISTQVAAEIVKAYGGVAGIPIGSIDQDFGRNIEIKSMALVAKNYNAGQATWRSPGIADHNAPGRVWMDGTRGPWFDQKQGIIDDYIVAMTYAYYQLLRGEPLENVDTQPYVQKALANKQAIKNTTSAVDAVGCGIQGIAQAALALAWDTTGHGPNRDDAKPATETSPGYADTMDEFNGSTYDFPYSDCGVFVATVMHFTGADKTYPKRGTGLQLPYMQNSPKYQEINISGVDASQPDSVLRPGDILIFDGNGNGDGHTYIYTGTYTNSSNQTFNAATASWRGNVPQAETTYFQQYSPRTGSTYQFKVFRLIEPDEGAFTNMNGSQL